MRTTQATMLSIPILVLCSCSQPFTPTIDPSVSVAAGDARLTPEDAMRIAEQFASSEGINLQDYKPPTVSFSLGNGSKEWWIHYDGRVAMPGNHFSLKIDDATEDVVLHGGS